jgi:tetratricopeptide (TPR) repeat protein
MDILRQRMAKETRNKILAASLGAVIVVVGIFALGKSPSPQQGTKVLETKKTENQTNGVLPAPTKDNVSKELTAHIKHLKDVVRNNPEESASALQLARLLQDGHDLKGALEYYSIGLKGMPSNNVARIDYALCLYSDGQADEAMKQSRIVSKNEPKNIQACYNIGSLYANRGVKDSAIAYWSKVIEYQPKSDLAKKSKEHIKTITNPAAVP